ncbi:MAG: hypothetical protein DRJ32_06930 [Thermoprotei archaeon]|nr:MAG: hypothetical protein DRJ32_06930 [Thermoprotei archaeon]
MKPLYIVCPVCGRITAVDTGYCRHCKSPIGELGFLSAPDEAREYDVEIGFDSEGSRVGFKLNDLAKHTAVLGITGYGKTTFVKKLVFETFKRGIKVIVLDWEGEYRDIADALGIRYLNIFDLKFNPFKPRGRSFDYSEWLTDVLKQIYMEEYGYDILSPQMDYVLRRSVHRVVRSKGGFEDLLEYFSIFSKGLPSGRATALALKTRFSRLAYGRISDIWGDGELELTRRSLIVDLSPLSRISSSDTRFIVFLVLRKLAGEARWIEDRLRILVVIEEAEEIAGRGRWVKTWTLTSFLLRMRKRGIGLVFTAHSPYLIDRSLLKSVANIVAFRILDLDDAVLTCSLLGMRKEGILRLASLKVGEALIRTANTSSCFLVHVKMPEYTMLSKAAEKLLENIMNEPYISIRCRRAKLGMTGTEYSRAEAELVKAKTIDPVYAYTGRGRPVKLYRYRSINPLHGFGVYRVRKMLDEIGLKYRVSRSPDIEVEEKVAIEIETGTNIYPEKYEELLKKYKIVIAVPVTLEAYRILGKYSSNRILVSTLAGLRKLIRRIAKTEKLT